MNKFPHVRDDLPDELLSEFWCYDYRSIFTCKRDTDGGLTSNGWVTSVENKSQAKTLVEEHNLALCRHSEVLNLAFLEIREDHQREIDRQRLLRLFGA